jgi:hypothetical protein
LVVLGIAIRAQAIAAPAPAGTALLPDLRSYTPVDSLAITYVSGQKQLAFDHYIYNTGVGPLEIQPVYNPSTNTAIAYQNFYSLDASGNWYVLSQQQVGGIFYWDPLHGHYHYPVAEYALHTVAPDGSVGPQVALSPKIGFCLSDTLYLDPTLPHAADSPRYYQDTCTDPTAIRGLAIGRTDWYLASDIGEDIDLTNIANGVYWFRNTVDPNHYLYETDTTNDDHYWKVQIDDTHVTILNPLQAIGGITLDQTVNQIDTAGNGSITSPPFNTATPGELLLAFVASDGVGGTPQTEAVSGAGLSWSLVRRTNNQRGTSEVWSATAPTALTGATVTARQSGGNLRQVMTVMALQGVAGVGASVSVATTGPLSATLTTTGAGSAVFAVGHDASVTAPRSLGPTQEMVYQWLDPSGPQGPQAYWIEEAKSAAGPAGSAVTLSTSPPDGGSVDYTAVEVLAFTAGPTTTVTPTPTATATTLPGATSTATLTPTSTGTATRTVTATPTGTAPAVLVGDQAIEAQVDSNPAGVAEAFQYTAGASGTVGQLAIYLDASSAASSVVVGLYANSASDSPGALLAQGTIGSPIHGAWNSVAVAGASVTAGTKYWIAVLGPVGVVQFRDVATGGKSQTSLQTNLTALPMTWSPGASYANAPLSAEALSAP